MPVLRYNLIIVGGWGQGQKGEELKKYKLIITK